VSYIAAAVALYVAIKAYNSVAYPRNLRHIKHIPALTWMSSLIRRETHLHREERYIIPTWKDTNGMVSVYAQFGWEVNVTNPEVIRTILYKTDIFPKTEQISLGRKVTLIERFFGKTNLAFANSHEWRRRRKFANPAFHRSMPVKTFASLTSRMFEQIDKENGPVDVQSLLQRFTLDAIGLVGFGFQFNATNTPDGEWVKIYNDVVSNIVDFKYLFFPIFETKLLRFFPKRMEKHANLTKLNQLFNEIIEHKKAELVKSKSEVEDSEKDLLTLMIEAGNDEGDSSEPLTNEELRDELVLFFVAGHDTTSNAMTAALYFLAVNPDLQEKARKEVLEVLGDGKHDSWPTLEQLKKFTYLSKVMKESIRLAPPAAALLEREAAVDTELAGVPIPKGTLLNVDVLGIHYNENIWKDPYKFDPERFSDGGELELHPSTYSYVPFGGGSRQCIGMNFSLAEQRVALSAILRKYELSLPEDSIHKDGLIFSSELFINGAKDMRIKFTRRY